MTCAQIVSLFYFNGLKTIINLAEKAVSASKTKFQPHPYSCCNVFRENFGKISLKWQSDRNAIFIYPYSIITELYQNLAVLVINNNEVPFSIWYSTSQEV